MTEAAGVWKDCVGKVVGPPSLPFLPSHILGNQEGSGKKTGNVVCEDITQKPQIWMAQVPVLPKRPIPMECMTYPLEAE